MNAKPQSRQEKGGIIDFIYVFFAALRLCVPQSVSVSIHSQRDRYCRGP
jgi:hypothetical protein